MQALTSALEQLCLFSDKSASLLCHTLEIRNILTQATKLPVKHKSYYTAPMSPQICWSTHIQRACLVDWSESTVIITKTTDWYCSKATTSVLYSEGRIRLVPVALYANGCPRWHIINSITNLSNNPRKPLVKQRQSSEREFAVVLLLTADRDGRFKE